MSPDERDEDNLSPLEGRYANYIKIGHNAFEFILDFGQQFSQDSQVQFHTRVVTGPKYAKEFLGILSEAVSQYELKFGFLEDEGHNLG
jgi:hypothetical protein